MAKNARLEFRVDTQEKHDFTMACDKALIDSTMLLRQFVRAVAYRRQEDMDRIFDLIKW